MPNDCYASPGGICTSAFGEWLFVRVRIRRRTVAGERRRERRGRGRAEMVAGRQGTGLRERRRSSSTTRGKRRGSPRLWRIVERARGGNFVVTTIALNLGAPRELHLQQLPPSTAKSSIIKAKLDRAHGRRSAATSPTLSGARSSSRRVTTIFREFPRAAAPTASRGIRTG